jgi:dGTPase
MREAAPEGRRCLEAQVMDWSDDVAYSVHDLEDALYAGHLRLDHLTDAAERSGLVEQGVQRCPGASAAEVDAALDRLLALPYWPTSYDGSQRALAGLKNATSQLIGRFCEAAERATRAAFGDQPLSRYQADLVVPPEVRLECEVLKAVAARYVMDSPEATERYASQRDLVKELVAAVAEGAPATLDPTLRSSYELAADDGGRLRVVLDHVAAMTDPAAVAAHARLVGPLT